MLDTERKKSESHLNHIYFWLKCLTTIIFIAWLLYILATVQCIERSGKVILLWNTDLAPGNYTECGCTVTTDRTYRKRKIKAIVFDGNEAFNLTGLSDVHRSKRFLAVYWVTKPFNELPTPPTYNGVALYNATMSYRQDSDLEVPKYFFAEVGTRVPITDFKDPDFDFMYNIFIFERIVIRRILNLKSYIGVYYAYPINSQTIAESTALNEIRRYFQVDAVFECNRVESCIEYKFMMVFDYTHCSDYIRPEFFLALKLYIVPVVFGDADYSLYAPPMSYINAKDYPSISDLAKHLMVLNKNDNEYQKYFWWHSEYSLFRINRPLCYLCTVLTEKTALQQYDAEGNNFTSWWSKSNCSRKTNIGSK